MIKPNPEQQQIIDYFSKDTKVNRVLLVEAPPGTGKTFTAVASAMKFIYSNINRNKQYNKKVLILTFSKNAKAQIERQLDMLSKDINKINWSKHIDITNFHSFFQRYVWSYSKYLGLKENLVIMSTKQRKVLLKERLSFIQEYDGNNNQFEWSESLLEGDFKPVKPKKDVNAVEKLVPYRDDIIDVIKRINIEGFIGFSDIAYYMMKLLKKSQALLDIIQNKYEFFILDEYQDTSDMQDTIVKKLIGKNNKAIFFADSKQMIYGWRGASSERLHNLLNDYKGEVEIRKLSEIMRYKNRKDIENTLIEIRDGSKDISDAISSQNIKYIDVEVEDIDIYDTRVKNQMYATLKYKILNCLKYGDIKNKSVGILCRGNELVNYLRKAFKIEFNIYLRTLSNNEEEHNIICDLIEFMKKEHSKMDEDEVCKEVFKFIFAVINDNNIGSISRNNIDCVSFKNLKKVRLELLKGIRNFIEDASKDNDYYRCLYNCINLIDSSDLQKKYEVLILLRKALCLRNYSEDKIMSIFLQYQQLKAYRKLQGVYVLNVHQSKGREFDYVYLIDREAINKEDNLLYVAMSRAKEKLVVFDWLKKSE